MIEPKRSRMAGMEARHSKSRLGVRVAYLFVYAAFAALGESLLARPALAWFRGLGFFHAALPWQAAFGQTAFLLAITLAVFTLRLAIAFALGERLRLPEHALFLLLLAFAFVVRSLAGDPQAPNDPGPALLTGLRSLADEIDRQYGVRKSYSLDLAAVEAILAPLPAPGFQRRGRRLALHARLIEDAVAAQLEPLAADEPGTIYLSVSSDRRRVWLTALTLREGAPAVLRSSGKPLVLQARAGTHSAPGRDSLVPGYPGMKVLSDKPR